MSFFKVIANLLPNAKAWRVTTNKNLRLFFEGLAPVGDGVKTFFDSIFLDIFPETTRELDAWEQQFGIRSNGDTDAVRREKLAAAWQVIGGQSPRYLQDTLQAYGFDVYVHEWWEPGTEPSTGQIGCATPRNPFLYLSNPELVVYVVECGEPLAQCGEPTAEAGDTVTLKGYALVNRATRTVRGYTVLCGETLAQCGETTAEAGEYAGFIQEDLTYILPTDTEKWPYFLYIGGVNYGDFADIPLTKKTEFEELCLKICPSQQWLGIIVNYV